MDDLEIMIGSVVWKVKTEQMSDDLFGETVHLGATIKLNKDQTPCQWKDSLLHELLHAAVFQYAVPLGDAESEEIIIKALTPVLLDLLSRNPLLVERLVTPSGGQERN